jgi:hypothetical protein
MCHDKSRLVVIGKYEYFSLLFMPCMKLYLEHPWGYVITREVVT